MSDTWLAVVGTAALVALSIIVGELRRSAILRWSLVVILAIVATYCAGVLAYRNSLFQDDLKKNIKTIRDSVQPQISERPDRKPADIKASLLELVSRASSLTKRIEARRTDVLLHIATASGLNTVIYFPSDIIECEVIRGSGLSARTDLLRVRP